MYAYKNLNAYRDDLPRVSKNTESIAIIQKVLEWLRSCWKRIMKKLETTKAPNRNIQVCQINNNKKFSCKFF